MRLNSDYLGKANISPKNVVKAGRYGTWELIYTVGKYGIDDTGVINIAQRSVSDWEIPQFSDSTASGYTTVRTNGNASLDVKVQKRGYIRPWRNCLWIKIYDGYLKEGDQIKIIFGDKKEGSPGIKAQSFCETSHEFKVLVDPFGTGRYQQLPKNPKLKIVSGPAAELQIVVPSLITPNIDFDMTVRCLDDWGNPCSSFQDEIQLKLHHKNSCKDLFRIEINEKDNGYKRLSGISLEEQGVYWLSGKALNTELEAISNSFLCQSNPEYNLYWGDIHGQTEITIGTGSLEEYFEFGRGPAALDFCSWQGNDFQITNENWEGVKNNVKKFNRDGEYITFLGYEWSGLTAGGGDHNIYFLDDNAPLYRSNQWLVGEGKIDDGSDKYPITKLWEEFKGKTNVFGVAHIGGRHANLDFYDSNFVRLIEVHSHHGTFEWFIEEAMRRDLKVGFIAGSDDHSGRPGLSYPTQRASGDFVSFDVKSGYVAVYANELTRKSIWEALQERRCYATTDQRIYLKVKVNNCLMGQEITSTEYPNIDLHVIGTKKLQKVEIKRGNKTIYSFPSICNEDMNKNRKKIRIVWSGVRAKTRSKRTIWDGVISLNKGRIISAKEYAFDRNEEGIFYKATQMIKWNSTTSGDQDGIMLEIEAGDDAILAFQSKQINFELTLSEIINSSKIIDAGGINQKVEVSLEDEVESKKDLKLSYIDKEVKEGNNAYWARIIQEDGSFAWSSPVYVEYQK